MRKEFKLERHGCKFHYWLSGPKNGSLIVFTHGATLDHTMFDPQIDSLTKAGYRVLTWDMRGHGRSKPMGKTFSVRLAADDLIAILDTIGEKEAIFVGQSFGGYVVQEIAYQHPDRVKAIAILGCTDITEKASVAMRMALKILPAVLPLFSVESFQKRTAQELSIHPEIRARALEASKRFTKSEFLAIIMAGVEVLGVKSSYSQDKITKPFLLMHGQYDKANNGIFPKSAPVWSKKSPQCTYQVIPDAGHVANQDNPDAFNTALLNFLAKL